MNKKKNFHPDMGNVIESIYAGAPKKKKISPPTIESVDDISTPAYEPKSKKLPKIKSNKTRSKPS